MRTTDSHRVQRRKGVRFHHTRGWTKRIASSITPPFQATASSRWLKATRSSSTVQGEKGPAAENVS